MPRREKLLLQLGQTPAAPCFKDHHIYGIFSCWQALLLEREKQGFESPAQKPKRGTQSVLTLCTSPVENASNEMVDGGVTGLPGQSFVLQAMMTLGVQQKLS